MTWFCRDCEVQNSQTLQSCRQCKQHWSKVWQPKRKSRSKSRKYKEDEKEKAQTQEEVSIFPSKVPWIQTTPSRSMTNRIDGISNDGGELQLPPQPVLPPPPIASKETQAEALTSDEQKMLEHLRGIQNMGMDMPVNMQERLNHLVQKEQKHLVDKSLTHGHINRLNKLKGQVAACGKKVQTLDIEWNSFVQKTQEKVRLHALMYQQCRANLMENYNSKLSELQLIKEEVNRASQTLLKPPEIETLEAAQPDVGTQMEELARIFQEGGQVESPIEIGDASMEEEELVMDGTEADQKKPVSLAMKPFRSAASPSGVAKAHLKMKDKEQKDGKHRDKEDK